MTLFLIVPPKKAFVLRTLFLFVTKKALSFDFPQAVFFIRLSLYKKIKKRVLFIVVPYFPDTTLCNSPVMSNSGLTLIVGMKQVGSDHHLVSTLYFFNPLTLDTYPVSSANTEYCE